jgi:hypothetical protein
MARAAEMGHLLKLFHKSPGVALRAPHLMAL